MNNRKIARELNKIANELRFGKQDELSLTPDQLKELKKIETPLRDLIHESNKKYEGKNDDEPRVSFDIDEMKNNTLIISGEIRTGGYATSRYPETVDKLEKNHKANGEAIKFFKDTLKELNVLLKKEVENKEAFMKKSFPNKK